jgi:hypothetical protein
MRAARFVRNASGFVRDVLGFASLLAMVLLASPGVRLSHAEADFSYDPALAGPAAGSAGSGAEVEAWRVQGPSCPASRAPALATRLPRLPSAGAGHAIEGEGSSLNGRGYNIGPPPTLREIQVLNYEARLRER